MVANRADGTPIVRDSAAMPVAGFTGNIEALANYAGQGARLVRDILPAANPRAHRTRQSHSHGGTLSLSLSRSSGRFGVNRTTV